MRWQFWIDRGGTFTDCIGRDPASGSLSTAKVLSSRPRPARRHPHAARPGARRADPALRHPHGYDGRHQRPARAQGAAGALVITRGFRDLLRIGTQARPRIFDIRIERPELLYRDVLEVDARTDAAGPRACAPGPGRGALRRSRRLRGTGLGSVAMVLLHAYRAGQLESELGELAREAGFDHVSLSHEVAAEIGMLARGDTTVRRRLPDAAHPRLRGRTLRASCRAARCASCSRAAG